MFFWCLVNSMSWEAADVEHGTIHHHYYRSAIVGVNSEYYVYTPPKFDSKKKYPVLYLLHGYSDDPSAWTSMGKANVILDNLISQGKAKPMIVVMPLGYGTMDMITQGWKAWRDPELVTRNFTRFSDTLFQEVMPLVKREYPISTSVKNTPWRVSLWAGRRACWSASITRTTLLISEPSARRGKGRATTVPYFRELLPSRPRRSMPSCDCSGSPAAPKTACFLQIRNSSHG